MKEMKRTLAIILSAVLACGCYEDYVVDYEYGGVYIAYQYDLRSFIVGEDMSFNIGVVLGGVINNDRDRNVFFTVDDALLDEDLSAYGEVPGFMALNGMKGQATAGKLSQDYVTTAVNRAGIKELKPLPSSYFSLENEHKFVIRKGWNSGTVKLTADIGKLLSDPNVGYDPYYAVAFRITGADADTVLASRSYSIIAVRTENILFGDWYHYGKSVRKDPVTGAVVPKSETVYPAQIPCDDNTFYKYTLSTVGPFDVSTSYFHNSAGSMNIHCDGSSVELSDSKGRITDLGCSWNRSRLLQDRKVFLNYSYPNSDGTVTVVTDTLAFRARLRDGITEWQDDNPEHYNQ